MTPSASTLANLGRDEGLALAIVMFPLMIAAMIAASLTLTTQTDIEIAQNAFDVLRHRFAGRAAINQTVLRLLGPPAGRPALNGTVVRSTFADDVIEVSVVAETAKINLNQSPNPALERLLIATCVPRAKAIALTDSLADYVDSDDVSHLHGLEKADYAKLGLPYGPRNDRLRTTDEVRRVPGMNVETFENIRPFVTAYSFNSMPDLSLAAPLVVQAVMDSNNTASSVHDASRAPDQRRIAPKMGFAGIVTISARTISGDRSPEIEQTIYLTGDPSEPVKVLAEGTYVSPTLDYSECDK